MPLIVCTARFRQTTLKLAPENTGCEDFQAQSRPLYDALADARFHLAAHEPLEGHGTPTLFDALPIAALHAPDIARFESLHVVVEADGLTREIKDRPANAQVAIGSDVAKVVDYMTDRLAR